MAPKKRSRSGASSSRPVDPFPFKDDAQRSRYEVLSRRPLGVSYYFDTPTLQTLGLYDRVMTLVGNIGWNSFIGLTPRVYTTLTLEFLSSYSFTMTSDEPQELGTVNFRLNGVDHSLPLSRINEIFSFSDEGIDEPPPEFNARAVWREYTDDRDYNPSSSKASQLISHSHRYIHRFISHTILGRGESTGVVNKAELLFLWCMERRVDINTGVWFCKHLNAVARKDRGRIMVGGLICHIAACVNQLNESNPPEAPISGNDRLNLERLTGMGVCTFDHGQYFLLDNHGNRVQTVETSLTVYRGPDEQPSRAHAGFGQPESSSHAQNDILTQVLRRLDSFDQHMTVIHSIQQRMTVIDSIDERMARLEREFHDFCQTQQYPFPPP